MHCTPFKGIILYEMDIFDAIIGEDAKKELRKVPIYIVDKLNTWIDTIEKIGLKQVQKIPGFHDEPLKGKRKGQRSIRLNRAYRAIYITKFGILKKNAGEVEFIYIEEVNKHDY